MLITIRSLERDRGQPKRVSIVTIWNERLRLPYL